MRPVTIEIHQWLSAVRQKTGNELRISHILQLGDLTKMTLVHHSNGSVHQEGGLGGWHTPSTTHLTYPPTSLKKNPAPPTKTLLCQQRKSATGYYHFEKNKKSSFKWKYYYLPQLSSQLCTHFTHGCPPPLPLRFHLKNLWWTLEAYFALSKFRL